MSNRSSLSNFSAKSSSSLPNRASLTDNSTLTLNHSLGATCTASEIDPTDGVCIVSGATCADYGGKFPCICTKYSSQLRTSIATESAYNQTWTVPHPYFNQYPPFECSDGCRVEAERVRILFWPVDDRGANTTDTTEHLAYTTISDGFTL